jgi:hypothetical protein
VCISQARSPRRPKGLRQPLPSITSVQLLLSLPPVGKLRTLSLQYSSPFASRARCLLSASLKMLLSWRWSTPLLCTSGCWTSCQVREQRRWFPVLHQGQGWRRSPRGLYLHTENQLTMVMCLFRMLQACLEVLPASWWASPSIPSRPACRCWARAQSVQQACPLKWCTTQVRLCLLLMPALPGAFDWNTAFNCLMQLHLLNCCCATYNDAYNPCVIINHQLFCSQHALPSRYVRG